LSCSLVRDRHGQPLHFIVQVQDITERKLAGERMQDMQAVLHMAAQVGHLGAWAFDSGGETLFWSEEVCAMLEVRQGFTPTVQEAMAFVAPDSRERMRAVLATCMKTGSPFDVEAQFVTARGRRIWVRMLCEAQWDAQGKVRRLQGALQDISQMRQAQHEILRLNAELEERVRQRTEQLEVANRELEAFSYSLAHDLRAPLASIDSFCHVLEDKLGKRLDPVVQHYLGRIRAGVQQMHDLSDGLLALTQVARDDLRWERVDLAALARNALAACHEHTPERTVERRIASALPVRGDPRLLLRVISNLVGNAWKFTARQPRALIEVGSVQGPQGQLAYYVRDNGAGFDMAQAGKMFQAFQRLHHASEFEGTGIGLAIVHKVVTRHGGQVWAESEPGRGATFYFTLGARPPR
jgi:PAS domain S-box-containing protein